MRKSAFPWGRVLLTIGGMGAVIAYIWSERKKDDGGVSLWVALGFPYGPIGNLPAIGADFKTGLNRTDGHNALPIDMLRGAVVYRVLTDAAGVPLTDATGAVLTDVPQTITATLFPSRNASGLRITGVPSGSKPS